LQENGYSVGQTINEISQGELIEATDANNQRVVIKKCDKGLVEKHQSFADEDGMTYYVDDDIVKEAKILKFLDTFSHPFHVQFVDFLESDSDYFLISQHIDNGMTLKAFCQQAHAYMSEDKLAKASYHKILKYIFWQLSVVLYWLHDVAHVCHLNVCSQSIMLANAEFIEDSNGLISINPAVTVKLSDFSKAEIFDVTKTMSSKSKTPFGCAKYSIDADIELMSPKLQTEEVYDARAADCWAFGMMLFTALTNISLTEMLNIDECGCDLWFDMEMETDIDSFINTRSLEKMLSTKTLSLIKALIVVDETKRMTVTQVLEHSWFKSYHKIYHKSIEQNAMLHKEQLIGGNDTLPYYVLL